MAADRYHYARNPETGWSIWGQRAAVTELRNAIRSVPNHSYVFTGPAQSGKRAAALDFARALCCPNASEADSFCGQCGFCRRIERGVFPDVTLFDLKTQAERDKDKSKNLSLNISTVREIGAAVAFRPTEAQWRIAIVDDVETMQETAQEAFLKTLEEPPPYAVIILLTSDVDGLLPTIRSRCVPVRFGLSPIRDVQSALEAAGMGADEADRIASLSHGAIGWAFEAANDQSLIQERADDLTESLEIVLASGYDRMVRAVIMADEFAKDRDRIFTRLQSLQGVWRTALYIQQGIEDGAHVRQLGASIDGFRAIQVTDLIRSIRSVDTCIANLESNVRPRLAMESMVIAWPNVTS